MTAGELEQPGGLEQSPSDNTLMEQLKQGDMKALEVIFMRYQHMVKTAIYRVSPTVVAADVEELVQDVFIALITSAPRFDHAKRLKPWLYGIAANKIAGNKRTGWLHRTLLSKHSEDTSALRPSHADPVDHQIETRQVLEQAFEALPKDQHDVMILHAIEGFKGQEIADILGIEVNTVWTRLHRARKTLTAELASAEKR